MILQPRHHDTCVMCQPAPARESLYVSGYEVLLRYCEAACEPDGRNGFNAVAALGDPLTPHLHAVCVRCRYEWLIETSQNYKQGAE